MAGAQLLYLDICSSSPLLGGLSLLLQAQADTLQHSIAIICTLPAQEAPKAPARCTACSRSSRQQKTKTIAWQGRTSKAA